MAYTLCFFKLIIARLIPPIIHLTLKVWLPGRLWIIVYDGSILITCESYDDWNTGQIIRRQKPIEHPRYFVARPISGAYDVNKMLIIHESEFCNEFIRLRMIFQDQKYESDYMTHKLLYESPFSILQLIRILHLYSTYTWLFRCTPV